MDFILNSEQAEKALQNFSLNLLSSTASTCETSSSTPDVLWVGSSQISSVWEKVEGGSPSKKKKSTVCIMIILRPGSGLADT